MADDEIILTLDQIGALADKLDQFGEGLEEHERRALSALLVAGVGQPVSDDDAEVEGFAFAPPVLRLSPPPQLNFSLLGDSLRLGGYGGMPTMANKTGCQ